MSSRVIPLFDRAGRPTTFMARQWTQKGGAQPIRPMVYLNPDRTAAPHFRSLWTLAFPTRDDLPGDPLVDAEGRASDAFWRVFA
jgi:hypothetical protein